MGMRELAGSYLLAGPRGLLRRKRCGGVVCTHALGRLGMWHAGLNAVPVSPSNSVIHKRRLLLLTQGQSRLEAL